MLLPYDSAALFALCGTALLLCRGDAQRVCRAGVALIVPAWCFALARLVQLGLFPDATSNQWFMGSVDGMPSLREPTQVLFMVGFLLWSTAFLAGPARLPLPSDNARRQIARLALITYLLMVLAGLLSLLAWTLRKGFDPVFSPSVGWALLAHIVMALGLTVLDMRGSAFRWQQPSRGVWAHGVVATQITLTWFCWAAMAHSEGEQLDAKLGTQSRWLEQTFLEATDDHIKALERMALRWEAVGGTPAALWSLDAHAIVNSNSGIQALAYFDRNRTLSRLVPRDSGATRKDFDWLATVIAKHPSEPRNAINITGFTDQVSLEGKADAFMLIRPLKVQGRFDGWLVVVFHTEEYFSILSKTVDDFHFALEVFDGDRLVYRNSVLPSRKDVRFNHRFTLPSGDGNWSVRLTPSPSAVDGAQSHMPLVLLVGGGLTALIMAMAFWSLERGERARNKLLEARHSLDELSLEAHKLALVALYSRNTIVILDAKGKVQWVNQAFSRNTGLDAATAQGLDYCELVGRYVTDAAVTKRVRDAIANGTDLGYEVFTTLTDGRQAWLEVAVTAVHDTNGALTQFFVVSRDVTEIKRAQMELDDRQRFLQSMINLIPDMIGYWDAELRCRYANSAYLEWFGRTPEQMRGITIQELMGEELFRKNQPHIEGALRGEPQKFERTLIKADGATGYAWAYYRPDVRDGKVQGFFVTVNDITEVKSAQLQLLELNTELKQRTQEAETANRAKSVFLSSMSHELRTPMNAMLGFAQLIDMDSQLPPQHKENVNEVLRAGRHLLSLINDLLSLSKIEAGHTELQRSMLDASELVEECLALVRPMTFDTGAQLESDVAPLVFESDRRLLKQVLINLLTNAIKYNRPGGRVWVSVRHTSEEVRLTVNDEGVGIARHRQAELFQSFNRLGAEASDIEGHGIGLAVCHRLVQVLGGTISAISEKDVGSSFTIALPLVCSPKTDHQMDEPEVTAAPRITPSIILQIEDNFTNRRLVQGIFAGYKEMTLIDAVSGEAGLALAERHRPDLILLDIQLPDIDGFEVLRRLRDNPQLRHIPVIALSANVMEDYISRVKLAGFDAHISKPFEVATLMRVVSELVARSEPS